MEVNVTQASVVNKVCGNVNVVVDVSVTSLFVFLNQKRVEQKNSCLTIQAGSISQQG